METLTPYKTVDNFLLVLFQAVIILWPFGPDSHFTRHWPLMPKHYWTPHWEKSGRTATDCQVDYAGNLL
jgi:hypothetical protein